MNGAPNEDDKLEVEEEGERNEEERCRKRNFFCSISLVEPSTSKSAAPDEISNDAIVPEEEAMDVESVEKKVDDPEMENAHVLFSLIHENERMEEQDEVLMQDESNATALGELSGVNTMH